MTKIVNKKMLYWYCQFIGWTLFILTNIFFLLMDENQEQLASELKSFVLLFVAGLSITHIFKLIANRINWLSYPIYWLVPFALISAITMATLLHFTQILYYHLTVEHFEGLPFKDSIANILNLSGIMVLWVSIYLLFHFIRNYRKSEITKLHYINTVKDAELARLKAQMNPHFMFNSMNSIRALIDEDPAKAKEAVTKLAYLLRSGLNMDKQQEITLHEEMKIVMDYLSLEKIRFEERLNVSYDIPQDLFNTKIPPMMLQTLAENAVKHGISQLPQGGQINITAQRFFDQVLIIITNTGFYEYIEKEETGIGLKNTAQRLKLLYNESASFSIKQEGKMVVAEVKVPA